MTAILKPVYDYVLDKRWVFLVSAVTVAVSLYLHLKAAWTPLRYDSDVWIKSFNLHQNYYPYNIRFFQTYTTICFHKLFSLPLKDSFFIVQYSLSALLSILFYDYLKKLEFSRNWSLFGVALLMLSFPIAAAHFEPVHTWDDFWLYVFSVLSFSTLVSRKWLLSSVFFTLGCFAREQMLLFYPVFLLEAWRCRKEANHRNIVFSLLLPLIIYGLFFMITYEPSDPKRWSLITYNFANSTRSADATTSIWNAFGFLWIPAIVGAVKIWRKRKEQILRFCFWGAVITVPLTLILGAFFTLVRETRILFPPFVFVIPLAIYAITDDLPKLPKTRSAIFWTSIAMTAGILIFLGIQLANLLWPEFDYAASTNLRRDLAGINIGLAIHYLIFLFLKHRGKS